MTRSWQADPGVVRDAFTLPLLFLTVALGGGLRIAIDGTLSFSAPPLMALVLAVMVIAMLFRSGVLRPDALLDSEAGTLANVTGAVVIATLFAASAQALNALTPEAGLLALAYNLAFLVLFGNTLVTRPDRPQLLGSLLVVFGAAFVVKYVVLGALYAPNGGLTRRVVMALVEGVSLGTLAYQPPGAATGYVAFGVGVLFLIGLALMPVRPRSRVTVLVPMTDRPQPPVPDPDDR